MPSQKATSSCPLELGDVFTAMRDKAKQGNPQAAAQYLQLLTRYPPQLDREVQAGKALEDMTPDELAFAEAYELRRIARAQAKAEGLRGHVRSRPAGGGRARGHPPK